MGWSLHRNSPYTVINTINPGSGAERFPLEQQREVLLRPKVQIDSLLLDVLEPKEIKESKSVVVAGIQLVVSADAVGILMRVARSVVILSAEPRLPRKGIEEMCDLYNTCAGMNGVIRVAAAL